MKIIWERGDFDPNRVFYSKVPEPRDPRDLRYSHYRVHPTTEEVTHKTCTRCSQEAGRFVWHPIRAFGSHRIMADGSIRTQAQCNSCRGKQKLRLVA